MATAASDAQGEDYWGVISAPSSPADQVHGDTERVVCLDVAGLTCNGCVRKVQDALNAADGVANATVNFETKRATVCLKTDSHITEANVVDVVQSVGQKYKASQSEKLETLTNDVSIPVADAGDDSVSATLLIGGMTCNSCAASVESSLTQTEGVISAVVTFATEKAVVRYDKSVVEMPALIEVVESVGYEAAFMAGDKRTSSNATLLISGMTCNSCANSVENVLKNTKVCCLPL
ncbi:Glutathione S-transferase T1 [Phytophthora nicotianae]|uniref:Glutathione S-transferase T1 n=1 Tax=Phytophthora nicotianae TaxID=4792 RepID=A0A0W8DMQ2_PHYNI|nr:Glutathione S-transferase T1 [Phytophthora nicotianae]